MNDDRSLHRPALYNPALWSREEVKTYYIARQPLLTRLLGDLRRERPGTRPQHRLIVGLRGMGKSTLLHRLAVAVEDDPELAKEWLPLTFPEEQYNIGVLADFWRNCLDALSYFLEERRRNTEADTIDKTVANLARRDAEGALQALIQAAKQLDRRLLLLVDNIDLILDRLKDCHWNLRETWQSHPEMLVVGASARALEASYQYDAAFYDFFKVDELRGLSEQEMRDTLLALAKLRGIQEIKRRIEADPSRIRILHTLTGGNPRIVVLLYGVLLKGMDSDVRADLEGLLDEVTPLYKARFAELPVQGQQLLDKLALHWDPMTARQLADALNWDVNLVSAQVNRLTQLGIVEKVKSGSGKRAAFQVGERFFNIWYLMRASRRMRRKLVWLVEFLRIWYSGEDCGEVLVRCHQRFDLADDAIGKALAKDLFPLFQEGFKIGASQRLLKILDDSGAGERWRPLQEALAAAVAGNTEILLDVAPEVRKPALEVLARIAPDLPVPAELR